MIFQRIQNERRREKRYYCNWPIWFAAGRDDNFFYGDIVDYSADSLALICKHNVVPLEPGCLIKIYFGYSHTALRKASGVEIFSCEGSIYRIEDLGRRFFRRTSRIIVRLDKRLPFVPSRIKALKVIFEVLEKPDTKEQNKQLNVCSVGSGAGAD